MSEGSGRGGAGGGGGQAPAGVVLKDLARGELTSRFRT